MTTDPDAAIRTFVGATDGDSQVSPISFIYGSGAGTDEVYFTRRGDEIFELPMVWLERQKCWGSSMINPYGTGDRSRPLSPQCLECHTVWVDYHAGSLNEYGPFEPQLLGVSCERCHGPARQHVEHHRTHPAEKLPVAIVQPGHLDRERLMDVCAQCHTNSVRHRRAPFSYRPGESLEESFHVLTMKYPEHNRVANQVRYLKESRCYQESHDLTCITCHDPHRKPDREDSTLSHKSCLKCHNPDACGAQSRLPTGVRDQCATCHMPKRNKVQVNFETEAGDVVFPAPRYEHRIAVYPDAEQEMLYEWYTSQTDDESATKRRELGTKLHEHWRLIGDSARSEHRLIVAIDAYRTALQFGQSKDINDALAEVEKQHRQSIALWFEGSHQKQEQRLQEAIDTFESLLLIQPDSAKTHYELGTLYASVGSRDLAVKHLDLSRQLDVNDPGPEVMLGWLDYIDGKYSEALEHYLSAERIEPWSERIEQMIGQCQSKSGRWGDAAKAFERALVIDPHAPDAARDLRAILRERMVPEESLPRAVSAVRATGGKEPTLLLALAEIYKELGQFSEAQQTLAFAINVVPNSDPVLLFQMRSLQRTLDDKNQK